MAPLISPEVAASSSVEAASATVWDAAPLPAGHELAHVRADVIDVVPGRADVAAGRGDGLGHAAGSP